MDVITKIQAAIDYQTIYAMEDDFNEVGLTIQTTSNSRVILCKIKDGKPYTKEVVEDYIFVGSLDKSDEELSDRAVSKICDFVQNTKGKKSKVENIARAWRNGLRMYEQNIAIMNEDVQQIAESVILRSKFITD